MAVNRAHIIDQAFIESIKKHQSPSFQTSLDNPIGTHSSLLGWQVVEIFESMLESRHMDIYARELKKMGQGFYTIGSSGHECNAAVAAAARLDDMAFLHYRSGPFYIQRAKQHGRHPALFNILLGMVASKDDPISGGRHKVFGSKELNIPPQTSTIASHLPKAVGAAFTIARQKRMKIPSLAKDDSIVICTFGDASSNHSTASGAFNIAALADHQNLPCPVLFVCEDNSIGISTRTPERWVYSRFKSDPGIKYFSADGLSLEDTYETAKEAVEYVRQTRRPTFLHLNLIRLLGHAGSDVEQLYRPLEEIKELESRDPVLATAKRLIDMGLLTRDEVLQKYEAIRNRIIRLSKEAIERPKLLSAAEIIEPLSPLDPVGIRNKSMSGPSNELRKEVLGRLPEDGRPRHMAMLINAALADIMIQYPESFVFGEDVGKKGGVYHVTAELQKKFGVGRCFNSPLDETAILGMAIGAGHTGMLPIPEIQYLAYLHNAIDQIRGEACSLQFFSKGQYQNPMVVRIASLAYQKGFGGHFHNTNSIAALRDIPGLLIACPSNGRDAALMLRTCMAAAKINGTVSAFLEPIALYMTKDLHEEKDGLWTFDYPSFEEHIAIGESKTWTDGKDLTLFTYANGLHMSLRVAKRLNNEGHGIRVVDLRWLNPLPSESIIQEAVATGRVLVVDECRKTGGVAEGVLTLLAETNLGLELHRITGNDSYIPLGDAANRVLVQEEDIEKSIRSILEDK